MSTEPVVARISRSVLSDEIYLVVREMILSHDIEPEQRINIDGLSARLGVSPTPLREALARLESEGLVVKTPLRGYTATPLLSVREFVELSQFRTLIEPWTARAAAASIDADGIAQITAELESARRTLEEDLDDVTAYRALTEHDARFHTLLASLAGNGLVVQAFERIHFHLHFLRLYLASRAVSLHDDEQAEFVHQRFGEYYRARGQRSWVVEEHSAIAAAVIAGQGDEAARLVQEHIESSRRRFEPVVAALAGGH
ncbi:GntR family transcriptional regulator [Cellulomonas sp. URHD0024]|uniref:GntR family transcriptional regulator n=1 Tax=Cellulomonas sp. URHD0024 TaxID=1302620 RepID=UPI000410FF17|nr:GntR family transcriptional regulator [Cellulomonas sp. URHD0024]